MLFKNEIISIQLSSEIQLSFKYFYNQNFTINSFKIIL